MTSLLHQLVEHPKWWNCLQEKPTERSPALVEEALRYLAPVQSMFRITKTDAELGGTHIPAGSMVVLCFGSANRDETQFADPDEFNPERSNAKTHLAFGSGIHACLGAPLARLQARIALEKLATRFRSVKFGPDNDFVYGPSFMLRGFTRLSLVFDD